MEEISRGRSERLPVTETGYRSHFIHPDELALWDRPEAFVLEWLNDAACHPDWQDYRQQSRQLTLFQENIMTLMLHTGGEAITYGDLRGLQTHVPSASHVPIPHRTGTDSIRFAPGFGASPSRCAVCHVVKAGLRGR